MKKFLITITVILLVASAAVTLIACNKGGDDVGLDDQGNIILRPGQDIPTITFWGYGDQVETNVFNKLVASFNELYKGQIEVKYIQKAPDGYTENVRVTLGGSKGPDVFYADDESFKALAEYGYLLALDDYIAASSQIKIEDMWASSINRYRYDTATTTSDGANAKYWGIPKDIGPTVIYYNESYFESAGVTVISVAEENLSAFNSGAADSRGKTKAQYGITGEVKVKGFFTDGNKKYFNNQIGMSWEETVECARLVQNGSAADYGYFTEWWFNYGWSVGGDCIEYIPTDDALYNGGYWNFTLMDPTKNYIVDDGNADGFTVNGKTYNAGEIISYQDKFVSLTAAEKQIRPEITAAANSGLLDELPSQREAFVEFVRLGQGTDVTVDGGLKGYGVTPNPNSIGGDAGKTLAFTQGKVAMLIDGRWNVPAFRLQMDGKYKWDVAPLPVYRRYDAAGNVAAHGVPAGHSGSVSLAINAKSKYKNASWKFIEYIGGATGQTEQALSGFSIPTQRDIANTEAFLQTDKNPKNSIIFVRAAAHQTPGDWWYLRDKQWIDPWAGVLNGDVRNGKMTLSQFEQGTQFQNTNALLREYTKKR
jgi:ABC-type sugar transport system, periplasmic component